MAAGDSGKANPEAQVRAFIAKFDPQNRTLIRAVRKALRRRFITAYELAYDNYNFFVLGYSPTDRPSDAVVSMAAGANGVGLCFIRGATLPDPKKGPPWIREPDSVHPRPVCRGSLPARDEGPIRSCGRAVNGAIQNNRKDHAHRAIHIGEATTAPKADRPPNKAMKLTSVERIERSQLTAGVRRTMLPVRPTTAGLANG